jgi:hypothetical protein
MEIPHGKSKRIWLKIALLLVVLVSIGCIVGIPEAVKRAVC